MVSDENMITDSVAVNFMTILLYDFLWGVNIKIPKFCA